MVRVKLGAYVMNTEETIVPPEIKLEAWGETYKTVGFVRKELESLVDQAIEAEKCAPPCRREKEKM